MTASRNELAAWPRKFRTFWCVVMPGGTAMLVSARIHRARSIAAFRQDMGLKRDWRWWYRAGYRCQPVDIKVRNSARKPSYD